MFVLTSLTSSAKDPRIGSSSLVFVSLFLLLLYCQTSLSSEFFYLSCDKKSSERGKLRVALQNISDHGFHAACPEARDWEGKLQTSKHLCLSSRHSTYCYFELENVFVYGNGVMFSFPLTKFLSFQTSFIPKSMGRSVDSLNFNAKNYNKMSQFVISNKFDCPVLVPTRLIWDEFSHLSFQTLPLLAMAFKFLPVRSPDVYWHASTTTAAILRLLGVSDHQVIVGKSASAKKVLIPWYPKWNPLYFASIHGITAEITRNITQALLKLQPPFQSGSIVTARQASSSSPSRRQGTRKKDYHSVPPLIRWIRHSELSKTGQHTLPRCVVVLSRGTSGQRSVRNEKDVERLLERIIDPRLDIIVIRSMGTPKTIEEMYSLWHPVAQIISRAKVILGPHGGALNNLVWAPSDCHIIEFNLYPSSVHHVTHKNPRSVYLNAFFMKGGTGKYWVLPPTVISRASDFYLSSFNVSIPKLSRLFYRIDKGDLVRSKHSSKLITTPHNS